MHVKYLIFSKGSLGGDYDAAPTPANHAALILCSVSTLSSVSNEQIYSIP